MNARMRSRVRCDAATVAQVVRQLAVVHSAAAEVDAHQCGKIRISEELSLIAAF